MKHTVSELVLDNGAKGLLINVPNASVMTLNINFRAGEYLVERDKWEAPHIMEHVLFGANKKFPKARDFQADFEKNGAYLNASTSAYDIIYEAECADFEWQRILDGMILAITEPLFLKEEFEAEVGNVQEELTSRSNNHFRHLNLALREKYGFHAITYQERLKLMNNVKLEDLQQHYKKTHTSSNMRFVVAGKIPSNRRAHIKTIMENITLPKGRGRKDLPVEKPVGLFGPLFIENDTVDNYYFYMDTFMKRRMSDPQLYAMSLVNSMLTETLYSRILGTAREKGLVYGMNSSISYADNHTNWWIGAQVRPDNAADLFDIIILELKKIFNGDISDEDIAAAKQYQIGRFQRSAQTVGGIANGYMGRYFFEDFVEDYFATPAHIKSVTKRQIVGGMKELFSEDNWGMGILGGVNEDPVHKLHEQLSVLWR